MRVNLPVTHQEFPFPPGESLVSTTDTKGRITYCNPSFIHVSGYVREELLGQPHNLIRHPDMPEEAFRDMWATIARGNPWTGLVVNRRKNGDHYWVVANVTPLLENGQVTGYMSVRTCPDRASINAATALYATMREEAQRGHLLHRLVAGRVVRATPIGRLQEALRPDLDGKLMATAMACAAVGLGCGMALAGTGVQGLGGLALAGLATLGLGLGTGWVLRHMVTAPLRQMLDAANRMAGCDLTQPLAARGHDLMSRLSRALNQLNVNLASVVGDARTETENMHGSTHEIASGNHDLSARTESQAANLQQTAASMEQITGTVRQSADNADHAATLARKACEVTERGSTTMQDMTRTMNEIRQSSDRIAEINGVIGGIAFQTNILALNAAVEAARAGEHGRGFAVVAAEVRALAGRTTAAAREVKALIDESAGKVQDGTRLAGAAQQTLADSVEAVRQVGTLIGEVSAAAHEQLRATSQVNEAVSQMDMITQQNAALVEEVAAATSSLESQAGMLAQTVRVFRVPGAASSAASAPDAVALRRAGKATASARTTLQPA